MKNNMDDTFRTKDLSEATALDCIGIPLAGLERHVDGRSYFFVFGKAIQANEASRKYWSGELMVSARNFADSMRRMKDRIFAQER